MRAFLLLILGLIATVGIAFADVNLSCPDAEVFSGKLITNVNWATAYSPMRLGGAFLGDSSKAPDERADSRPVCICPDNNGVPEIGSQMGYWEPSRLIEVVRNAYCSPAMGGEHIFDDSYRGVGGQHQHTGIDSSGIAFYYYNYWAFPLMAMLDLFVDNQCSDDGWIDMDLMYVSGVDPAHESDLLSAQLAPEVALVSRPEMQAVCAADAVAATAGFPLTALWWCAGSWGNLYPFTGNVIHNASPPRDSSLVATRAISSLHRRGLARRTMGDDTMCKKKIHPIIPKTQYQMSMFYPIAEVRGSVEIGEDSSASGGPSTGNIQVEGSHVIGQSTFMWGEWRNLPAIGEDFLYVLWRWNDCCLR